MIILFRKSQLGLFEEPVHVGTHVRKDGVVVHDHVRMQKKAHRAPPGPHKPPAQEQAAPAPKRARLDAFIEKHGGEKGLASVLGNMTAAHQQRLFAEMARIGDITPEQVAERFGELPAAADKSGSDDMFAAKPQATPEPTPEPTPAPKVKRERKAAAKLPEPNGAHMGPFFHGTPLPFDEFREPQGSTRDRGAGYDHQGPAIYLTNDPHGYGRFFARESGSRLALRLSVQGKEKESNAVADGWGSILSVKLADDARILDMDAAPKKIRELFDHSVGDKDVGDKLRRAVREAGYDGIVFTEPNSPEGWELARGARTIALYNKDKAIVTGSKDANEYKLPSGWSDGKPEPEPVKLPQHDASAPFGVVAGTSKPDRRQINTQVIDLLERGGPYTDGELGLMRQYSGNGGCGDSLNEYYTDPDVTRSMWSVVGKLGVTGGSAFEPSCATGVFLHTAPAGFKVTGVELDPVSAKVAQALHGDRHDVQIASLERFATMDDRQFDVVIGNPPYGPRGMLAKDDKKYLGSAEQYFVDTAIDKAAPGGIIALVVPTGIMDSSTNRSKRQSWLCRAEFLGAQRLPNTAFEHSHTEVTTDVIYLRKRPDAVGQALNALDDKVSSELEALKRLGVWDEEFIAGTYFTGRGAGNIMGSMGPGWRAQAGMGEDITVSGSMAGVPETMAQFEPDNDSRGAMDLSVQDVVEALPDADSRARALRAAQRPRPYQFTAKVGDTKTVDGVQYVLQGDPPRWHRIDEFVTRPAIAQASQLAADIDRLITGGGAVDRPALEEAVRAYVKEYGIPADNPDLMTAAMADRTLYRLVGAVNRKGELSDAVLGTVRSTPEAGFDATAETMALEGGSFTPADLAKRLGQDAEEVVDHLIADARYAWTGGDSWTTTELYLTGELWPKLDAARAQLEGVAEGYRDKLQAQIKRLEETIDPKSLEDVEVKLNSGFVPLHVVSAFFNWKDHDSPQASEWTKKQAPMELEFRDGVFVVSGGSQWGDAKLLDKYLNRTGIRKEEDLPRIERLNDEFKEWLCASSYRDAVEDLYNRKFRGFVQQAYSDTPIDVPGLTTDRDVRPWRWSSLRRSLADGKGIIADDVGLGKTLGGLILARMAKMQGTAKRPMIVVPKSVLANWYAESQSWFPGSRVLTIGANFAYDKAGNLVGRDDAADERKRKYHDLTQNDYDFVFISEPAFEEIDLNPELKERYYSDDFWVQRGEALGNAGDKRRKAIKERYEQHIANREFEDRTNAVWFDDLGVDMLIGDELHHQKNLYAARARFGENPKFLGGQGLSNRSLDFNLKARFVREHAGGKGVYGLTATPTKNSPLEIYSMLSHIAPEEFDKIGIRNSEDFLDRFCEFTNDKILGTNGSIEDSLVVSGFKNLDELRQIMFKYIDRRTAQDVGLKLPERDRRMHLVDMTKAQHDVYEELRALAEESSGKKDASGDSHIFSIMDKMNKASLDLELLGDTHAGAESPKFRELAKNVVDGVKEGGQIVFCESVPSHDKIVRSLVDGGIPREQIGVINAQVASSSVKRQNIADKFNDGKLKVVIGNCVMAEGLNLQKTTTDIHELDIPWEPATVQQRLGRGIRQGNLNESVRTHSYLAKGSFDGYRYQSVHAKRDWMDLLWNGGDRVENLARESLPSLDDMRIMLSADPDAARAKFDEDKVAAQQRYDAGAREDAQKQFVRFQDMARSYAAQKNKGTKSATMLRARIEAAKTALFNNKYWPAKAALDSATDTLIHPQSGAVLNAGVGLENEKDGKMVVTGVNMRAGTVTLRRFGDTSGSRSVTVPLAEVADTKPYDFNAEAEASEVASKLEADAENGLSNISKWEELANLPPAVIDRNAARIQEHVKAGAKDYHFHFPYGAVPMVDKASGKLEMVEGHHHNGKHDTHDYLLPTSDAKEKLTQAFIEARRSAKIGSQFIPGKRGKSTSAAARKYGEASYDNKHRNPFHGPLKALTGGEQRYGVTPPLVKEALGRLKTEQIKRIRHAQDVKTAFDAIYPLAKLSGRTDSYGDSGHIAKYPKDALAMLWAKARRLGALNEPMGKVFDEKHSRYAIARHNDKSVHNALVGMAIASGHRDLAEAMLESEARHNTGNDPKQTVSVLAHGFNNSRRHMEHLKRAAQQAGLHGQSLSAVREMNLTGPFAPPTGYGYGGYSRTSSTLLGEAIDEQLKIAKDTEEPAAAEAAEEGDE